MTSMRVLRFLRRRSDDEKARGGGGGEVECFGIIGRWQQHSQPGDDDDDDGALHKGKGHCELKVGDQN